jgi:hypothetical protein
LFSASWHTMLAAPFAQYVSTSLGFKPILRELIHKPADRFLDKHKINPIDLISGIIFIHNCHPDALLGGPGVTKLPNLFGPLSLPATQSTSGLPLSLLCMRGHLALRRFRLR